MSVKFNLIVDNQINVDDFEYITEEANLGAPSTLYVKGPFLSTKVNRNKRIYPADELRREVGRYMTEMVKTGRAMGELNHPASTDVNLERACHMVTELREEGDIFYGKSKVLSTPCGQIVKSLINTAAIRFEGFDICSFHWSVKKDDFSFYFVAQFC